MIRKILCPTDFSPVAINAVNYACNLAKISNANLTLLHVQKKQSVLVEHSTEAPSIDEIEESIRKECKLLCKKYAISCTYEVEPDARDFIDWTIHRSSHFDLLVMGSNGVDTMKQFLFGSNAFNIIKNASIPVLIVPERFNFRSISRIIYAFDHKPKKLPPLDQLMGFAALFNTEVCFLTIVEKYSEEIEEEIDRLHSLIYSKWNGPNAITFNYIYYSDVVESLVHYYKMWSDSDILVLAAHHHGFFNLAFRKSVIKEITSMAKYPVLVIHE